jgi:hypothetical protein
MCKNLFLTVIITEGSVLSKLLGTLIAWGGLRSQSLLWIFLPDLRVARLGNFTPKPQNTPFQYQPTLTVFADNSPALIAVKHCRA